MKKGVLFCFSKKLVHASILSNVSQAQEKGNNTCSSNNIMMTYRANVFFPKLLFIWLEKAKHVLHGSILFTLLHYDYPFESKNAFLYISEPILPHIIMFKWLN